MNSMDNQVMSCISNKEHDISFNGKTFYCATCKYMCVIDTMEDLK